LTMQKKHLVLAVLVTAVWGLNFPVTKLGLAAIDPLLLTALRFTLAALPWVFFVERPRVAFRWLAAYGLIFGVAMWALINLGIAWGVPPGTASLLIQFSAFFTLGWGVVFFGERLGRLQWLGTLLAAGPDRHRTESPRRRINGGFGVGHWQRRGVEHWQRRDQSLEGAGDFRIRGVGELVSSDPAHAADVAAAWLGTVHGIAVAAQCDNRVFTRVSGLRRDALQLLGMEPAVARIPDVASGAVVAVDPCVRDLQLDGDIRPIPNSGRLVFDFAGVTGNRLGIREPARNVSSPSCAPLTVQ
jgi:uncharacterized membrane protein